MTTGSKGIVSFDFDGTLTRIAFDREQGLWINTAEPNERMVRMLKRLHARGFEIHIVTRRPAALEADKPTATEHTDVAGFLDAQGLTHLVAAVHFCGDGDPSGDKTETLRRVGPVCHYDDSPEYLEQARSVNVRPGRVKE